MPIQDKVYLKSKFENGDNPLQDDFADLIDSLMHVNDFVVDDVAYDPTVWNDNPYVPTKNSVRDKFVLVDAAIAGKANEVHTHTSADITDFNTAVDGRIAGQKGVASGLATLDGTGKIPNAQLPALAISSTFVVATEAAQLALTAEEGDVAVRSDIHKSFIKNAGTTGTISDWQELLTPTDAVLSVNGHTGTVDIVAADISDFNTAADGRISAQKGVAGGIATLDGTSKIPVSQIPVSAGTGIDVTSGVVSINTNAKKRSLGLVIDGGGSVLTTGIKGDIIVPANMTVTGWTIIADQSGSIVIDVWKDSYANYPATVADTIAGSEKPTLSSSVKNQNNSLSSWTTSLSAGDIIRFNVDSVTTVTRITLIINTLVV